jgi:hypothetical protein
LGRTGLVVAARLAYASGLKTSSHNCPFDSPFFEFSVTDVQSCRNSVFNDGAWRSYQKTGPFVVILAIGV